MAVFGVAMARRLRELLKCGKRERLVRGATNYATFGKPTNPPHRSRVTVHNGRDPRRFSPESLGAEVSFTPKCRKVVGQTGAVSVGR
jgi:hypothetical protein